MIKIALSLACLLTASAAMAAEQDTQGEWPIGEWVVKDKTAHIRVLACDQKLWGVISWVEKPGMDTNNPDSSMRSRSVLGLPILRGMQADNSGEWDGNIYNADNGKIYKGSIRLKSEDVLQVRGCILGGLICGGEDWTRLKPAPSHDAPDDTCSRLDAL